MRLREIAPHVIRTRREAIERAHEEMAREGKKPVVGWDRLFMWALWLPLLLLALDGFWIPLAVYAFGWLVVIASAWRAATRPRTEKQHSGTSLPFEWLPQPAEGSAVDRFLGLFAWIALLLLLVWIIAS